MKTHSIRLVLSALNKHGVRFLVGGGLAVTAHGVPRFNADMNLFVQLDPHNIKLAFVALSSVGYRPIAPVSAEGFADPPTRAGWIRDQGMRVLRFYSDQHRETLVDLSVEEPFPFAREFKAALKVSLVGKEPTSFVSRSTLIRMREEAGRTLEPRQSPRTTRKVARMKRSGESTPRFDWSVTTWEGSRREQIDIWSRLTFEEILDWQESAAEFVKDLARAQGRSKTATRRTPAKPRPR